MEGVAERVERLREAMSDTAGSPDHSQLPPAATSSQGITPLGIEPMAPRGATAWLRKLVPVALFTVLVGVVVGQWPEPARPDPGPSAASIADPELRLLVVPPVNRSGDAQWHYLGRQVDDEMRRAIDRHAGAVDVVATSLVDGAVKAYSNAGVVDVLGLGRNVGAARRSERVLPHGAGSAARGFVGGSGTSCRGGTVRTHPRGLFSRQPE